MRAMRRYLLVLSLLLVPAVATAASSAPRVVAKIRVGTQPCAGVAAFGSFFETNYGSATLSRVNPRTNKVTRTGRLGAQPCGSPPARQPLDRRLRHLHASSASTGDTLKVVKRIRVGVTLGRRLRVRLGLGVEQLRRLRLRINPATNRIVKTIKTGGQPSNFAVAADALWVGSTRDARQDVYRIDPATNTSSRATSATTARAGSSPQRDAVWTANGDDTVTRLDPASRRSSRRSRRARRRHRATSRPTARSGSRLPRRLDLHPSTRRRTPSSRTMKTGHGPFVLRRGFGDMWVGSFGNKILWRIRP